MNRNEKVLCELFQVKGLSYISRPMLIKALIIMYDKVNQLLLDLYCIDKYNVEFNGMDNETRIRMEKGKSDLKKAGKGQSIVKILLKTIFNSLIKQPYAYTCVSISRAGKKSKIK